MIAEEYSDSDFRLVIGETGTSAGFQKLLNGQVNINSLVGFIKEYLNVYDIVIANYMQISLTL